MIARRTIPKHYKEWNRKWGAPFGKSFYRWTRELPRGQRYLDRILFHRIPSLCGPFAFQPNNTIREVEYPWAFFSTTILRGMEVLEIGGGLSGFQFVLSMCGCNVTNVDPGLESSGRGWFVDKKVISKLNRAFHTNVVLHKCSLKEAPLKKESFDRIFSISVLEHIPEREVQEIIKIAFHILKPGGYFVITLDLFLNLKPFTSREANQYGTNISVRALVEAQPFVLVYGDKKELYGYDEFDKDYILSNLDNLYIGSYPALSQLIILQKPLWRL